MKPIEITLRNIGPYENSTIDFSRLDKIFLITGNTGAGKTFIFDAMTYALYGELKGNRANHEKDLKSRYASFDEEDFYVDFTFQIAENIYKVHRTVEYTKPGNKNSTPSNVMFFRKKIGENEFEDLSGTNKKNKSDINKMIQNVVGLTASEFSKIVLLPQGAFAEFLKQGTNERQKTLEKLFPVSDYQKIIEETENRLAIYTKKIAEINSIINGELNSLKSINMNFENAESKINVLTDEIQILEKTETELFENLRTYEGKLSSLKNDFDSASEYENKLKRKDELDKKSDEIENIEKQIEVSEKANELKEFIVSFENAKNRLNSAIEELKNAEVVFLNEKNNKEMLENQSESMSLLKNQNAEDKTKLDSLKSKLEKQNEYKDSLLDEKNKNNAKSKFQNSLDIEKKELETILSELNNSKIELLIEEINEKIINLNEEKNKLEIKKSNCKERDELEKSISTLVEEIDELETQKTEKETRVFHTENSLKVKKEEIETLKIKNSAFTIASILKPGEACPVCGSKEHPCLAKQTENLLNPEEEIEALETFLESLKKEANKIELSLASNKSKLLEKTETFEKFKNLGKTKEISEKLKNAEIEYENAMHSKSHLSELQEKIIDKNDSIKKLEEQLHNAEVEYEQSKAKRETLEKEIGESIDKLQNEYDLLFFKYSENEKIYSDWEKNFNNAKQSFSAIESLRNAKSDEKNKAFLENENTQTKLDGVIKNSIFKNCEEAKSQMRSLNELTEMREICQKYRSEVKSIEDAIKNSKKLKPSVDISNEIKNLKLQIDKTNSDYKKNNQELTEKRETKTTYFNSYRKIQEKQIELDKLEEEQKPCKKLYEHLSGKNAAKVQFNTWALGMYFNQVVEFASQRFFEISNHRFEFAIKDIGNKTGNGYKGLDLQVIDHYTPNHDFSDTADLSGGETFEASISLALAITDVVQNNTGGISLDSLFIDEGFGTLDPEPLESTMKVLTDLSSSKTIGLISHVDSLQNSDSGISSKIVVHKTEHGSSITIE